MRFNFIYFLFSITSVGHILARCFYCASPHDTEPQLAQHQLNCTSRECKMKKKNTSVLLSSKVNDDNEMVLENGKKICVCFSISSVFSSPQKIKKSL